MTANASAEVAPNNLDGVEAKANPSALKLLPIGFLIGLLGAICGIGGGLFAVPFLHFGMGLQLRKAVGTAFCLVLATTLSATVAEALRENSVLDWRLWACLSAGALSGAQLGYFVSKRINQRSLRWIFVVVLTIVGVRILAIDVQGEGMEDFQLTLPNALRGVLIGFGGGFLSPLLGVGGGLLMVPALFLLMPGVNFLVARASSMAVGAVNGARSLMLYGREGQIDYGVAKWFGTGALLGGVLGVGLVNRPGWADYARIGMGAILILVAVRFFFELINSRKSEAS